MAPGSNLGVKPRLIVFDVNETLSDLAPLTERFTSVGAPSWAAPLWFASILRDGFALTALDQNPDFAELAISQLRVQLANETLDRDVESAVDHIIEGFEQLRAHPDVVPGINKIAEVGVKMITLSNGSKTIAEGLLERDGLVDLFDDLLSVSDAKQWKPAAAAYRYALDRYEVEPKEALMVAVHPWDLAGARAVGMHTAWVNRLGEVFPPHFPQPTWEGPSLVELANHLGQLTSGHET